MESAQVNLQMTDDHNVCHSESWKCQQDLKVLGCFQTHLHLLILFNFNIFYDLFSYAYDSLKSVCSECKELIWEDIDDLDVEKR